ncbi:hypothetical protein OKW34_003295 [Paraburkholderia youngii]
MSKLKSPEKLFGGRHFDREIILCVRWYLRYKLSFRDLVGMMAERGLSLAHTTILRWVVKAILKCPLTGQVQMSAFRGWESVSHPVFIHAVSKDGV